MARKCVTDEDAAEGVTSVRILANSDDEGAIRDQSKTAHKSVGRGLCPRRKSATDKRREQSPRPTEMMIRP